MEDARRALEEHFGYKSFRPGQEELISAILAGKDALGIMPTGAGKSLCYQIPAAVLPGLALVVSPLISLMGDQVRSLKEAGIRGSYLNSSLTPGQQRVVLARALAGWYDLMYVAPERLQDPTFVAFAQQAQIPLLAVDEAHCISEWGQDFRPAYLGIRTFAESLPTGPVVAAFTATATRTVERDIKERLGLEDPVCVHTGFDRPNLSFIVKKLTPKERLRYIARYLETHRDASGIVYCRTRKRTEEVADALLEEGFRAGTYHAGMEPDARTQAQEAFVQDNVRIIVATNAFGMGIDKSDVRFVINDGLPLTLEEYYQEAGRAGRDGDPAECILLWSDGDIRLAHFLIDRTEVPEGTGPEVLQDRIRCREQLLGSMIGYAESTVCLRARMLRYFGEKADMAGNCGGCSVCVPSLGELPAAHPRVFGSVDSTSSVSSFDEAGDDAEELFQRLRALRKRLADERHIAPYMVFSDATLRAMVRRRPQTEEEMLEISGVGQVKLVRYAAYFLKELQS
ncbi:MAG: RecQ family ATP-dependent DNA helicase [Atopobiaceae bacterium]